MKKCAYCGVECQPTREHIWPKTLIEKNEMTHVYSQKTNKIFLGEPVIKDVCSTCNNAKLSKLDSYLSSLFDDHLKFIINPGDSASLNYSYDLLLRSLLKISFNASRAANSDKNTKAHTKFIQYILNGGYFSKVMIRLQIVTSSRKINVESGDESNFHPRLLRCGLISYDGPLAHRFLIKLIAINSYWFYLIIPFKAEPEHKWLEMLNGFSTWRIQPGLVVDPKLSTLHIPVNRTTYFVPDLLGSLLHAELA
jgi:hypothetical protein